MLTKLLTLFPNAVIFQDKPEPSSSFSHLYFFLDEDHKEWVGIPRTDLSEKEFILLKALYHYYEPFPQDMVSNHSSLEMIWHDFLLLNGRPPGLEQGVFVRINQFQIKGNQVERKEFESALRGFFSDEILIIWENALTGAVIEKSSRKSNSLTEKEFISLVQTLESDFFFKITFYSGKQQLFSNQLPEFFQEEKEYFTFAQNVIGSGQVFSFERVFPVYAAHHLPALLKQKLNNAFADIFNEDNEMFFTIKAFLENNLNASSTAKKLYVHRNTLQYRVDKFTDKTDIQLKDFFGAFTVFLACLVYELDERHNNVPK